MFIVPADQERMDGDELKPAGGLSAKRRWKEMEKKKKRCGLNRKEIRISTD